MGSSSDASIGVAFVSFESYWGKKNKNSECNFFFLIFHMKTKLAYFFSFLEYKSDHTSFMIYSVIFFLKTTIKLLLPTKKT